MLTATQSRYALEKARSLYRKADRLLNEKHTRKVVVRRVEYHSNTAAYKKARASLDRKYEALRDALVLGDAPEATRLLTKFAKLAGSGGED